jgi:hypothetical protein
MTMLAGAILVLATALAGAPPAAAPSFAELNALRVEAPEGFELSTTGAVQVTIEWVPTVDAKLRKLLVRDSHELREGLVMGRAGPRQLAELALASAEAEVRSEGRTVERSAVSFIYDGYPRSRGRVLDAYQRPSFVVDYDVPELAAVREMAVARYGPAPSVQELLGLARSLLPRKDLARAFDPASVALRRGEGDCSEHAALLAAVLRMFGVPARMVNGAVLMQRGEQVVATGHAWVEYFADQRWNLADATVDPQAPAKATIYLPLSVAGESANATAQLFEETQLIHIANIRLEPARPPLTRREPERGAR